MECVYSFLIEERINKNIYRYEILNKNIYILKKFATMN